MSEAMKILVTASFLPARKKMMHNTGEAVKRAGVERRSGNNAQQ
jgi:hypothetical protein